MHHARTGANGGMDSDAQAQAYTPHTHRTDTILHPQLR